MAPEPDLKTGSATLPLTKLIVPRPIPQDLHPEINFLGCSLGPQYHKMTLTTLIVPRPMLTKISDKVMIPQDLHPEINFVGLLIGPRGNTLKMMEKETGAKVSSQNENR